MEYVEKNSCLKYISWAQYTSGTKGRVLLDLMSTFCSEFFCVCDFPEPIFQIFSMEFEIDTTYYSSLLKLYFCTWIHFNLIIRVPSNLYVFFNVPIIVISSSLLLDNFLKVKEHGPHISVFL